MPGETVKPTDTSSANAAWKKLKSSSPFGGTKTTKEDIVAQGKCLCGQYIRSRLRRAGYLNRKVTQRLRTLLDPNLTIATRDIFPALNAMAEELERMHPRVYTNVARQLSRTPFGELADADAAPFLLHATAKEMFKATAATTNASNSPLTTATVRSWNTTTGGGSPTQPQSTHHPDISWPKIISLFAVCAALAVDIVRQGHYDYLPRLLEGTGDIIEEDLAAWIQQHPATTSSNHAAATDGSPMAASMSGKSGGGGGGDWTGLVEHFRPRRVQPAGFSVTELLGTNWISMSLGGVATVYGLVCTVRWLTGCCCRRWLFGHADDGGDGDVGAILGL